MIGDQLISDLDILDHLELYGSTVKVGSLLGVSQSSCSRRYRSLSEHLDLDFDRHEDGYAPRRNLDVLSLMRVAAQRLRVRRAQPRFAASWQCAQTEVPPSWRHLPFASMDMAALLTVLDGRLIDLWLGGLLEFQAYIQAPLAILGSARLVVGQSLMALPLFRWNLMLMAHRSHPLLSVPQLTPEHLSAYPSPALPMGAAPMLYQALQRHGLGTSPYGGSDFDPQRWEAVAADAHHLIYAPSFRLAELERNHGLVPLPYDLGLTDVMALMGHRDVLSDPSVVRQVQELTAGLHASPMGPGQGTEWLR